MSLLLPALIDDTPTAGGGKGPKGRDDRDGVTIVTR
jgi:hypothetical protein